MSRLGDVLEATGLAIAIPRKADRLSAVVLIPEHWDPEKVLPQDLLVRFTQQIEAERRVLFMTGCELGLLNTTTDPLAVRDFLTSKLKDARYFATDDQAKTISLHLGEPTGPKEISRVVAVEQINPAMMRAAVSVVISQYQIDDTARNQRAVEDALRSCLRQNAKAERFIDPMAFVAALRKQIPRVKTGDFNQLKKFTHDLVHRFLSSLPVGQPRHAPIPVDRPNGQPKERKLYATTAATYAAAEMISCIKGALERISPDQIAAVMKKLVVMFTSNAYFTDRVVFHRDRIAQGIQVDSELPQIFRCDESTLTRALDYGIAEACLHLDKAGSDQGRIKAIGQARIQEVFGAKLRTSA